MGKTTESSDATFNDADLTLDEIRRHAQGETPAILEAQAPVSTDMVELERFMAEPVVICIHGNGREGELPCVPVTVNTRRVDIPLGRNVKVRRSYVEALARAITTEYEQIQNQNYPDQSRLVPRSYTSYSFSVVQDTQKGHAWLRALQNRRG